MQSAALGQIRIATYNINADTNGNTTANPGTDTVIHGIGEEMVGDIQQLPDIITLQETTSETATVGPLIDQFNTDYPDANVNYASAGFQAKDIGNNPTNGNGPNSIIYNQNALQLISTVGFGTLSSIKMSRQEVRYEFRPVGYGANSDFYVYVAHYKALGDSTDDTTNQDRRNFEAQQVRANAATLPAGSRIIYTGDFNLTGGTITVNGVKTRVPSSSEAAWQTLTAGPSSGSDPGQGIDPLGLASFDTNQGTFQGTYSESSGFGGGSLSARFDFQVNTPATMDGQGFSYIAGSYHVFGNNGTTPVHKKVSSAGSTTLEDLPDRTAVLNALETATDHYPVVADYRLPAMMQATVNAPSRVIVGATNAATVTILNSAPVSVSDGADVLNYSLITTGSFNGSASGTGIAALTAGTMTTISLAGSAVAGSLATGTIAVSSTSQEVANGSFNQQISTRVVSHAHPSLASAAGVSSITIDFGTRALNSAALGLGTPSTNFAVNNIADVSGYTAALDLDSILGSGDISKFFTNAAPFSNLAASGSQSFNASLLTSNFGSFSASYTLNLSDENIPGATSTAPLLVNLVGRIALAGDANDDGTVNALDFNALATNYADSGQSWRSGDFNGDGTVNSTDFDALAANFGVTYDPNPADSFPATSILIPEPTLAFALPILLVIAGSHPTRRRRCFRCDSSYEL